jgi:hypothetical protein
LARKNNRYCWVNRILRNFGLVIFRYHIEQVQNALLRNKVYCPWITKILWPHLSYKKQIQEKQKKKWLLISTSVLYIQASVFPGTCPYKVGFELCSNYVRFEVLIWGIVPHDDVICNFWCFSWCFVLTLGTFWGLDIGDTGHWLILHIICYYVLL